MTKRLLMFCCAALLAATPAWAARDALHSGKYKDVRAKSEWSDGKLAPNFSLTMDLTIDGEDVVFHAVNDTNPDKLYIVDWTAKTDGRQYPFDGHGRFNFIAVKWVAGGVLQVLKMKDDDVIAGEFWVWSPNGKVMTRYGVAKPEGAGKSKAYVEYFDKIG